MRNCRCASPTSPRRSSTWWSTGYSSPYEPSTLICIGRWSHKADSTCPASCYLRNLLSRTQPAPSLRLQGVAWLVACRVVQTLPAIRCNQSLRTRHSRTTSWLPDFQCNRNIESCNSWRRAAASSVANDRPLESNPSKYHPPSILSSATTRHEKVHHRKWCDSHSPHRVALGHLISACFLSGTLPRDTNHDGIEPPF